MKDNTEERIRHLEAEIESLKRGRLEYTRPVASSRYDFVNGVYPRVYYDDLQRPLVNQGITSPSSHIGYSVNKDYIRMEKTCDLTDWLTMVIQMGHGWKIGSDIYPHIHWIQSGTATPNLLIAYMWEKNGAVTNTTWAYIPYSSSLYTYTSGDLNQITLFDKITPPSGAGLSDLVHIKLFRDVANTSTKFLGAENDGTTQDYVYANSFDIHFQIDAAGSREEYAK